MKPLGNIEPSSDMFIFWSGWGILVPVLAILGAIIGTVIGGALGIPAYGPGLGLGLAALANWAIWEKVYQKGARVLWDPAAGREVHLRPKHSLFFIPAKAWTVVLGLLAVVVVIGGIEGAKKDAENAKQPGFKEFTAANDLIGSKRNGDFHGNTSAAQNVAAEFSRDLKKMTSAFFTGSKKLTEGDYLTYCHETPSAITILCHVPSLRKFKSDETKERLSQLAWAVGSGAADKLDPDHRKHLTVGLRGIVSYGSIQQGKPGGENPEVQTEDKESVFYPGFAPES